MRLRWCGVAGATCRRRCPRASARWRPSWESICRRCMSVCERAAEGQVVSPGEFEFSGADRDCRTSRGCRTRRDSCEGSRSQTRDPAAGERAVSLRAAEAGGRAACPRTRCSARFRICNVRWSRMWMRSRSRLPTQRASALEAPGLASGAVAGKRAVDAWTRACALLSRSARAKFCSGFDSRSRTNRCDMFNVEDEKSLENVFSGLL